MPPKKRRRFVRPLGERRYRKMFVLATEGSKTESQYFSIFNDANLTVHIKFLKGGDRSAPTQVLKRMRGYLEEINLGSPDEAWLVVDKDQWTDEQLLQLHEWAEEAGNYGFALSNPKFEFWLLLHFEDGRGVSNSQACSQRLKLYMPNYNKDISRKNISRTMIEKAVNRAKELDTPACSHWPLSSGTTVYRLVENILRTQYVDIAAGEEQ